MWLFARAHGLPWALVVIAAGAAIASALDTRSMVLRYGSGAGVPYAALLPVLVASAIAATGRSSMHELEGTAARALSRYRLVTLVGLTVIAALVLTLACNPLPPVSRPAIVRNLAGLTGVGLLDARFLGGRLSWLLPVAIITAVLSLASGAESANGALVWLIRPNTDAMSWSIAGALFVLGTGLVAMSGTREQPGDVG